MSDLRDEEVARQENRFKALQHQFSLLQLEVQEAQAHPSPRPGPAPLERPAPPEGPEEDTDSDGLSDAAGESYHYHSRHFKEPKLQKLSDEDDTEHFLITFE